MEPEQGNTKLRKLLRGTLVYFVIPLVCTGGPIAWFSGGDWWSRLTASLSRTRAIASAPTSGSSAPALLYDTGAVAVPAASDESSPLPLPPAESPPSLSAPPTYSLEEALRFDISPRWISERWPRVSAGLAQLQLQGYRVPLVTGTAEDDVAGALTYYFNPWQQVQRITFVGTTGDIKKIVYVLTARFGFTRRLTNDPSLCVYEALGNDSKVKSVLWVRHVPVVKATCPYERFEVALTLERPPEKK